MGPETRKTRRIKTSGPSTNGRIKRKKSGHAVEAGRGHERVLNKENNGRIGQSGE